MERHFGAKLKALRIAKGFTLREFCARNGFDPGNYSKVERSLFSPPGPEKIKDYAQALEIPVGSDEYVELLDLASVDRGQLPLDILSDDQVVSELPVLFRTLRGQSVSEGQLDELVSILKRRA